MNHSDIAGMYLVDEVAIVAQHDTWISDDEELRHHLAVINGALDFIDQAVRYTPHASSEHLIQLRLLVRLFNSAAAALRLIRCGYWQPAFATIRDILETHFLLDLLSYDLEAATLWISLGDKERQRRFSPLQVRSRLDDRDGFKDRKRQSAYENLSRYAAHPTPEGFALISPSDLTKIGPFPDQKNLRAALQELVKHTANASTLISKVVQCEDAAFLVLRMRHVECLRRWSAIYLAKAAASTDGA